MTAAASPIESNVGMSPMAPVPKAMPVRVMRKVYLRPTRSPTQPNRNAPNGRMRKPAVNRAIVLKSAATGWVFSKNPRGGGDDAPEILWDFAGHFCPPCPRVAEAAGQPARGSPATLFYFFEPA